MASLTESAQTNSFSARVKSDLRNGVITFIENELALLPGDWDGCGAHPIHPEVVKKSVALLNSLPEIFLAALSKDEITPNPSGTISIEWQKDGMKVFLEVGKAFSTYFAKKNGRLIDTNNNFHPDDPAQGKAFTDLLKRYFPA